MLNEIFDLRLAYDCLALFAVSHDVCLFLCKDGCLGIAYLSSRVVLDLEHEIDLLEGKFFSFNVEVPDDWSPGEVQDGKNDVKPPTDVGDG